MPRGPQKRRLKESGQKSRGSLGRNAVSEVRELQARINQLTVELKNERDPQKKAVLIERLSMATHQLEDIQF